jgi:uncharacterized membrane protein
MSKLKRDDAYAIIIIVVTVFGVAISLVSMIAVLHMAFGG